MKLDDELDEEFEEEAQELMEDWEEESPLPSRGVLAISIVVLIIVAAILCAILWRVTHPQRDEVSVSTETDVIETLVISEETLSKETLPTETLPTESMPEETTPSEATPAPTPLVEENEVYEEPTSGDGNMSFSEVNETVTAKDVTNVRSVPDTSDSTNVVYQLQNGATLTRTGINADTGWSRLEYDGQVAYAVTQYLTTDLTYKPPVQTGNPNRITTQDGRVIIFEDWDDHITPKEYVNLRVEPSTSQGETTVNCQVSNGTVLHRTGRSGDSGWSRVEYNGMTLYVVSNYMNTVEAPTE